MAVFVDEIREYPETMIAPAARRCGRLWSHMTADTPEELHKMAAAIGLKREWCSDHTQPNSRRLHYDVIPSVRAKALKKGALEISLWDRDGYEEATRKAREKATSHQPTLFDAAKITGLPD